VNHAEFLKRIPSGVYLGHRVLVHPPPRGSLALVSSALKGLATDPDTVVTLALPREWRDEFTDVARADAFPISCFHDLPNCGFVRGHHFAATTELVDVWLWENPAGRIWNASSMYLLKRRLRKELAEHCRTRYKGEPYDGGARGLNFADVRRGMTHYERNMRHPRRPPTTGDPAKLAAGDPHRDVYVEPGRSPWTTPALSTRPTNCSTVGQRHAGAASFATRTCCSSSSLAMSRPDASSKPGR